ncbi:ribosome biogenesis protein Rrp14-C [Schizosaccharomyces cryophilus OY26]|uniref:Ribosome biogenesis protein Rrp14-C n=1 Tax=Schizosaccharomyces cryophilus (strain OY26 / ATCC MYA-4695 / CBS 11777 / NBRC 106824 / NRRL Y48691) TaxID=653667 RepID=S9VNC3_SCHCR|nr:ribosome biogenesis protein Rrp14-C [Schizosaccharomyces cryophilus OY26]EPY49443.1 ribosome biogenesis protein Rrp14-C [Schizosaccharomyces cryophilus OY26]
MSTKSSKEVLQKKLHEKIENFRSQRKIPKDTDRKALIQARKEKAEARAQAKKKAKEAARQSEQRKKSELQAASEDKNLESSEHASNSAKETPDITFGTLLLGEDKFTNGQLKKSSKRKGPTDVYGAMKHLEAKRARIEKYDEEKKKQIEESDTWHRVLLQAEGKKLQDNEKLLKKTMKRKEKEKKKSSIAWKERHKSVQQGLALRQKKRQENLQKRRDSKKSTKKSGKKSDKKSKKPKPSKKK